MTTTRAMLANAALTLALLATPAVANAQAIRYRVVPLAEIPSAQTSCVPIAINGAGDVAGYCGAAGGEHSVGVLWRHDGTLVNLGRLPGGVFSRALGLNSLGDVVGDGDDGDLRGKALAHRGGSWVQIDGSGGSFQNAFGITDDGVIFGNFSTVGSPGVETWDPVFWTYDARRDRFDRNDLAKAPQTPSPGFSGAFVFAASRLGTAVGQASSDVVGVRAALWQNDAAHSLVLLPSPEGSAAIASGVSDDARAAGAWRLTTQLEAVMWLNDAAHTAVVLGMIPGDVSSQATGVNTAGQVVGTSFSPASIGRGFIHQNGALRELTALLDGASADWTINETAGINNGGQIIATGTRNGLRHPVVLVPFDPGPIASLTLGANVAAPQLAGTAITFNAAATGGAQPYEFKFFVNDGTTSTMVQDWSAASSFVWTPAAANPNYSIVVWARSDGNAADAAEQSASMSFPIISLVTSVGISSNLPSPQTAGTPVTFSASATGGTEPYQFKWSISDGATEVVVQDWNAAASFAWTPALAGNYEIIVGARSAGSTADAPEQTASMPFQVVRRVITGLTLAADSAAPQVAGTTVTFTAAATGGTAPYQFKWFVNDGVTSAMAQDWSAAASFAWTPATANPNYIVTVWARSADSADDAAEQTANLPFAIARRVVGALGLTADKASPQLAGTTITFTAAASGGTAPYQFKWFVNDGAANVVTQDWSDAAVFSWTPAAASANYQISVWVRSADSTENVAEQSASMAFAIARLTVTGLTLTADKISPQVVGTSITFAAAATGGTAPYQFKWLVNDGAANVITVDWSASDLLTWTPLAASASYQVTVLVRSADSPDGAAEQTRSMAFAIIASPVDPGVCSAEAHDNRDGLKLLPGERKGKGAPECKGTKDSKGTKESKDTKELSESRDSRQSRESRER